MGSKCRGTESVDPQELESNVLRRLEGFIEVIRSEQHCPKPEYTSMAGVEHEAITGFAKVLYRARQRRERHFPMFVRLFGEPVWDICLDLFIAGREHRRVSVSSACIAANVPGTTALRWLQHMEAESFIIREPDPSDRRRAYLRLAPTMTSAMESYITELLAVRGAGRPMASVSAASAKA